MFKTETVLLNEPDLRIVVELKANELKNNMFMEDWHFKDARQKWNDTKDALDRAYGLACKFNAVRSVDEYERKAFCCGVLVTDGVDYYEWRGEDNAN